ncbi:MAG: serine/threonine-protein kinase, partial [Planctomycetota bacterium]
MSLIDFASLVGFNVGPYRLKQLLGRGAMGAVYLGWDGAARRLHAVKVLRPELAIDDAYLQRFFQEAEIGSSIRHDNLVRIHRGGMDDVITPRGQLLELPWLCMDFISGTSVSKHVGEGGKLEPLMAAEVIRHVLVGVGFAHSKGLLHGDVKPDNIMVSSDGTVMLADFGLARRMGSGATEGNSLSGGLEVLGTPYFMPPELWAGAADVDPRADLFSVGASFYRLLTGRPPFPGTNPSEVLHRLLSADADPVNSLNPAVDAQLSGIVMRMLSRRRDDRYRSAEESGKMVQMWISSQKDADETGLWAALVAMGAGHAMD